MGNNTQHGHSKHGDRGRTPTYNSWHAMWRRTTNPRHHAWRNYGGRGIKVCVRWLSFEAFLFDMGERPRGTTLDRFPDRNGAYKPSNCRWATVEEQANNRRTARLLTVRGKTLSLTEWSRINGVRPDTMHKRLEAGWSAERTVTEKTHAQAH
jgi:hypothetical protein